MLDRREEYARANAEYSAETQSLHVFPNAGYILNMHKAHTSASETTELKGFKQHMPNCTSPLLWVHFTSVIPAMTNNRLAPT